MELNISKPTECCEKSLIVQPLTADLCTLMSHQILDQETSTGRARPAKIGEERIRAIATIRRLRAGAPRVPPMVVSRRIAVEP
jgi:hypothetical protein